MTFTIDPRLPSFIAQALPWCIGIGVLLVVVFVGIPLVFRFSLIVEAITLLLSGLSSYFENRTLVYVGCLAIGSLIIGCCVLGLLAIYLLATPPAHGTLICTQANLCAMLASK